MSFNVVPCQQQVAAGCEGLFETAEDLELQDQHYSARYHHLLHVQV